MNAVDHVHAVVSSDSAESSLVSEQAIRERAYELYLQRGGEGGTAEEDWLRAESELAAENSTQQAA